jgi:hypothetical protein
LDGKCTDRFSAELETKLSNGNDGRRLCTYYMEVDSLAWQLSIRCGSGNGARVTWFVMDSLKKQERV